MNSHQKHIAAVLLALIGSVLAFLFIHSLLGPSQQFTLADFKAAKHSQQREMLSKVFTAGRLPSGEETAFLGWAFTEYGEETAGLVNVHALTVAGLPKFLSEGSHEQIRAGNAETGLRMIALARELYPQDPDVLGNTGVVLALTGRNDQARELLEEAAVWRQRNPLHDFYLGGILLQAESTAERTRGKQLLLQVISLQSPRLVEPAAMMLLANPSIPLLPHEIRTIESTLSDRPGFWEANPRLTPDVLKILINRFISVIPSRALQFSRLLLNADIRIQDRLSIIALHQRSGESTQSAELLQAINPETIEPAFLPWFRSTIMVQHFIEEQYEAGQKLLDEFVSSDDSFPFIEDQLQLILSVTQLPLETERQFLQSYLNIGSSRVDNELEVLSRLFDISPLRREQWEQHASEKLFPKNPALVGNWLIQIGAAEKVVVLLRDQLEQESIEVQPGIALFEAFISLNQNDQAGKCLDLIAKDLDPTLVAFFRARLFLESGELAKAKEQWLISHQLASRGNLFPIIKNLGFLAISLDQPQSALQSLVSALNAGIPFDEQESSIVMDLTLRLGSSAQALMIAEYLSVQFPENPLHTNNLAYLCFMLEKDVEVHLKAMEKLVSSHPERPEFLLTQAFGLLKSSRAREASRLLQSSSIEWQKTPSRGRLIYALVLAQTDQRTAAGALIESIDTTGFLPEEQALLQGL